MPNCNSNKNSLFHTVIAKLCCICTLPRFQSLNKLHLGIVAAMDMEDSTSLKSLLKVFSRVIFSGWWVLGIYLSAYGNPGINIGIMTSPPPVSRGPSTIVSSSDLSLKARVSVLVFCCHKIVYLLWVAFRRPKDGLPKEPQPPRSHKKSQQTTAEGTA